MKPQTELEALLSKKGYLALYKAIQRNIWGGRIAMIPLEKDLGVTKELCRYRVAQFKKFLISRNYDDGLPQ
jgi:hypothetical protein